MRGWRAIVKVLRRSEKASILELGESLDMKDIRSHLGRAKALGEHKSRPTTPVDPWVLDIVIGRAERDFGSFDVLRVDIEECKI